MGAASLFESCAFREHFVGQALHLALFLAVENPDKPINQFGQLYLLRQVALDLRLCLDDQRILGA